MGQNTLEAHERTLGKIFSSDFEFSIPEYQRPYRWGVDQAVQLLEDLQLSLELNPEDEYFLGSLVLVDYPENRFEVVDGQQRLTTLTMIFAILRDLADSEGQARELGTLVFEPGHTLMGIEPKTRLQVRKDVNDFFRRYVQESGRIAELVGLTNANAALEPMQAVRENSKELYSRLSSWTSEKRSALATFMLKKTFLVTVTTSNLSSAHRIFSVMNSRGLDLSPADIFKSMVIGQMPGKPEYALKWEEAEELLGAEDFTELFRDIRTVESGQRGRRELLQEFPDQVLNRYLEAGRAADFVDEVLMPYSAAFARTSRREYGADGEWSAVKNWLGLLARVDNKDWRPAAVWALKNHPDDHVFLDHFLRRLERLAACFLLRGSYTTPRILRYLELVNDLKEGVGLEAPSFVLSEEETRESIDAIDGDIYKMQTRRARYILLRLDELLKTDGGVAYESKVIQIEHVLPRTPTDPYWTSRFPEEARDRWTHRIGNLLLLNGRANRKAQNFPFPRKRDEYFSKGSAIFQLTAQVINEQDWTVDIISKRQAQLTGLLRKEWRL